ncbi:MAG: hypothetical protein IK105_02755 [Thermoguttaceae bacterium]|nr:hypothetical protein [Thermoguttaceae bacterium]MBR6480324.1 hypothetical protein [Thermoguttaceae bacterium]
MNPVDIYSLNGLPAPYWFIQLFKVLGFILHSIPMHLWLAGLPIAIILLLIGGANGQTFARRLLKQMPVVMALGINLGIVPLLFIQAAYYKVFYPSTILMAWHWLGILALVLPAYYLLYLTSSLVDAGKKWLPALSGCGASFLLVSAGLIFASAWTLMASPESWAELWRAKSIAGAATGLGSYWGDPVVYLRFVSICGLALLTVTFWLLFDSYFLFVEKRGGAARTRPEINDFMENPYLPKSRKKELKRLRDIGKLSEEDELEALEYGYGESDDEEGEAYQRWALRFASVLVWFGVCITLGSLWFYYYKVLDGPESVTAVREASMTTAPAAPIDPATGEAERIVPVWIPPITFAGCALFALTVILGNFGKIQGKFLVVLVGLCEAVTLTFFAITRQIIQNGQIKNYLDVRAIPVQMQLSPLLVFLLVFLFGAALIYWMIYAMVKTVKR